MQKNDKTVKKMSGTYETDIVENDGAASVACCVEYDLLSNTYASKPALESFIEGSYAGINLIEELIENKAIHKDDINDFTECFESVKSGSLNNRRLHVRLKIIGKKGYELFRLNFCRIDSRDGTNSDVLIFFYGVQKDYGVLVKESKKKTIDSLTGLNNQIGFVENVDALLQKESKKEFLIAEIDVNQFKTINELFGIEEGNRLLRTIAEALEEYTKKTKETCVCARLRADVFAVCMPHTRKGVDLLFNVCNKAAETWSEKHRVFLAFGLYIITDRSITIEKMLEHSRSAVNESKGNYLQSLNYFDAKRRASIIRSQVIVSEMEEAISKGQFDIYFQPKCSLKTGEIIGAEALVRWFHPERGMVSPIDFIPLFEKCGLIYKLDTFVWRRACETMRDLIENDYPTVPVSMNVSRIDLCQPDVYMRLTETIESYNIPTQMISLEITESAYSQRGEEEKAVLRNLQSYGFKIELDDFGSAYSSINFLCETNVDVLKLDLRSIEGFSENDVRQKKIIASIGFLADQMEIPTVVEGIETGQQKEFLQTVGFSYGQGYYFYKPMPIHEFGDALLENAKRFAN